MEYFLCPLLGMVKTILEEGFPQYRCPYEKGDLVIKFDVAFPPKNFTDLDHLQVGARFHCLQLPFTYLL